MTEKIKTTVDVFQNIVDTLQARELPNGQFKARCPAHDDNNPSLSLSLSDDGCILFHCHAGCTVDAIRDALGLEWRDLFPEKAKTPRERRFGKLVKSYVYTDESGNPLYRKNRFEPKDFSLQGYSNGQWTNDLNGARRVLYRLPEVLEADTVYLCEGEKSADAIRGLGVTATSAYTTTGWRDDFTKSLQGKRVVILADNDETGLKEAFKRKAILGATVVNLGHGKRQSYDPYDWVQDGGTAEDLAKLTAEDKKPKTLFRLTSLAELTNEPDKEWLIDNFLGVGDLAMVFGPSESGKTFLAINLACMLARGTGKMSGSFQVNGPKNVVYMSAEGRSGLAQRFLAAMISFDLSPDECARIQVCKSVVNFVDGNNTSHYTFFLQAIREQGFIPDVIIIDHLSSTVPGKGDSDQAAATLVGQAIADIQHNIGAAVVLIHHTGYDTSHSRGMTNYKDILDVQIKVMATNGHKNPRTMSCEKNKDGPHWQAQNFDLVPVDHTSSCTIVWNGIAPSKALTVSAQLDKVEQHIRKHPKQNTNQVVVAMESVLDGGRTMVENRIKTLCTEKRIIALKDDSGHTVYQAN